MSEENGREEYFEVVCDLVEALYAARRIGLEYRQVHELIAGLEAQLEHEAKRIMVLLQAREVVQASGLSRGEPLPPGRGNGKGVDTSRSAPADGGRD